MQSSATANMNQPTIPLHCIICTKKPDFSDISHLLTHISSKQHLSNYFKVKVRAIGDAESKQCLDEFDSWYDDWNIDELLRDRMQQKEKKRTGGSRRTATAPASRSASVASSTRVRPRDTTHRPSPLDPHFDRRIKVESQSRSVTPNSAVGAEHGFFARAFAPPIHNWSSTPYSPYTRRFDAEELIAEVDAEGEDDDDPSLGYNLRPERQCRRPRHKLSDEAITVASSSLESPADLDDLQDEEPRESMKLKGVLWPGMDIFDSATPEMQRKRNQKKANNVLAQLEATSMTVAPDEVIYDLSGQFLKQRKISGDPDLDGSPLKGETTPEPESPIVKKKKKGRARRPRQPLADKDINGGDDMPYRRTTRRQTTRATRSRTSYFENSDEQDDLLTYGESRARKRTGLSIHRDNTGPDITFEHPAPINYLTGSFASPYQVPSSIGPYAPNSGRASALPQPPVLRSQSSLSRHSSGGLRTGGGSESFQPPRDLSAFGQITNMLQSSQHPFSVSAVPNARNPLTAFQNHYASYSGYGQFAGAELQSQNHFNPSESDHGYDTTMQVWDDFNTGDTNAVANGSGTFDVGFGGPEFGNNTVNPLYFSNNHTFHGGDEPAPPTNNVEYTEAPGSDNETISVASSQK